MECHRNLNQSLQKSLFFPSRRTPDVFEYFVSLEKLGMVEQANPTKIGIGIHVLFWHTPKTNLAPQREVRRRSQCLPAENYIVITGGHEEKHGN